MKKRNTIMLDTNKILNYQKEKKNITAILVICDFTKFRKADFLPYYIVASKYGYHSSDIVFKDYREAVQSIKLSSLEYSKKYRSIIVFDVPKVDFNSSFLGDLAREDDPYHIYPYLLYFEPSNMGDILMTPKIFENAICRAKVYANSLCSTDTGFYFLTNRKEYCDDKFRPTEYNLEEKISEAESIDDEDERCRAINEVTDEFSKMEELYFQEKAAALILTISHMAIDPTIGPNSDNNLTYSFYFFSPIEKVKARKFALSLKESDKSIKDIWLYYVDKEGRKYKSCSEAVYTSPHFKTRVSTSIPVEEKIKLYNILEQNNNFLKYA